MPELEGVDVVGSRQPSAVGTVKGENEDGCKAIVAVAVGFRSHDNFSLSPISVPVSIAISTRVEQDATGSVHEQILEAIANQLSQWHKFGDVMTSKLSSSKFFAGELRMNGGTGKQFDSNRSAWVETVSLTIRGTEIIEGK